MHRVVVCYAALFPLLSLTPFSISPSRRLRSTSAPTLCLIRRLCSCQAFLWSVIVFIFSSIFWLLRLLVSIVLTVIPLLGLVAIGATVYYYPTNVLDVLESVLGGETDEGASWEDVDTGPVV